MTAERAGWRGDIEGLRSLAIVPVVLFHLDRTYAPGGFLGVDLFLVISGYLIARMLLTGSYLDSVDGIRRFLRRRFLRIMPALAVTVAATSLVFVWLALPVHHRPFFVTGLASLVGVSNVQLARLSTDYFAPAAGLNPFLHTWSVSIEDQFYVGFVLLLALAARVAGMRRLPAVIVVATVVAVEYAWLNPAPPGTPGFFSLRLRAWEFLLGATALVVQDALTRRDRAWPEPVRWVSLLAILWAIVRGSGTGDVHQYVLCVACAPLLVRTTPMTPSLLSRGLAHGALRAIGRRSFAIYLVHFPLLKLFELFTDAGRTAPVMGVVYLGATALLAELLHRGVERPYVQSYRDPGTEALRGRPRGGVLWASAVAVAAIALVALPRVSLSRTLVPRLARTTPRDYPGSGPEIILLGDSHAQQLYPALLEIRRSDSIAVVDRTMIGCLPSEELTFVRDGAAQPGCQYIVRDIVANAVAHPRPRRVVLIAMRAQAYLSDRRISRFDRPTDGIMDS
ncbi:MAG TPA: acyltransferase family protein, partial [Gemmatimonadaceae bacterium]|nr:acyltransferase family protein [Gemmatimonadaceae bacterium]